jgi:hypothetical protein
METSRRITVMLKWLAVRLILCSGVVTGQSFTFNFDSQLVSQTQTITNFTSSNGCAQFPTSVSAAWLTASITANNGSCYLNATVNPSTLAPSKIPYSGTIDVYPTGSPEALIVPVTVTVTLNPINDFAGNGLSGELIYNPRDGTAYTALSNGNGTFRYVYNLFTPGFDTLRTGDFNGDGKTDIVLYNSQTALAYIGFGKGDGTFNFQSLFWSPGYDIVETGDINNDGKTDVLLYNSTTGTMYIGISNGDGTFTYQYTLVSQGYTFIQFAYGPTEEDTFIFFYRASDGLAYEGADYDPVKGFTSVNALSVSSGYNIFDSVPNTYTSYEPSIPMIMILYNSVNGNAAETSPFSSPISFIPLLFTPGFTAVNLGPFDGFQCPDLTLYDKNSGLAYFGSDVGEGNIECRGTFNFKSLFWSPGYDNVVAEDVKGDGKGNVILYNSSTGTEYTAISNGDGTFTYTYSYWGIGKVLAK